MDKILLKEHVGEFFSKMYEANRGKNIEMNFNMKNGRIQIYYKDRLSDNFDYLTIAGGLQELDTLVQSLTE